MIRKKQKGQRSIRSKLLLNNIRSMDGLVESLTKLNQVVIMGNSPHINHLNYDLVNRMVSIGVNRIGFKYNPNILLWTDCSLFTSDWEPISSEYRDEYHSILKSTKSDVKVFRGNVNSVVVQGAIAFDTVKEYGHEWGGGLVESPSVCTAIHLAMVAKIKTVYVAGVDMASNEYFFDGKQFGSKDGKFRGRDMDYQLEHFEKIRKANQYCEILLCSPKSNIPGFKKTDYLNETSYN